MKGKTARTEDVAIVPALDDHRVRGELDLWRGLLGDAWNIRARFSQRAVRIGVELALSNTDGRCGDGPGVLDCIYAEASYLAILNCCSDSHEVMCKEIDCSGFQPSGHSAIGVY